MASRRKDTDLPGLAARAEREEAEGDPTGFMSGAFFYSDFAIILGGCIDFDPVIPEAEQKRIIQLVAHDSSPVRPITADSLLKRCSKLERDYPVPNRGWLQVLVDLVAAHNICRPLNRDSIEPGFSNLLHDCVKPRNIIWLN